MAQPSNFGDDALGHLDALYATARRLTRNPAEAEDLVQDTYVKAFRHQRRFRPGTNLRAWLFAILHNTFLNDIRRRKGSPVEAVDDAAPGAADRQPAPGPTPEDALVAEATAAEIDAALAALPEPYREAVWLRDVQELSYAEIAGVLQVPAGTVMSRIARGRRLLHDRLHHIRASAIRTADPGVKAKGT
ncbi:MAG TPA: sigma-70 family RNA polymerase sigma factor [Vicinamibacterales bacterium]|nr:sigma-70 family RNA polymerase sigma factor [Vicinamibacterales bacterium]